MPATMLSAMVVFSQPPAQLSLATSGPSLQCSTLDILPGAAAQLFPRSPACSACVAAPQRNAHHGLHPVSQRGATREPSWRCPLSGAHRCTSRPALASPPATVAEGALQSARLWAGARRSRTSQSGVLGCIGRGANSASPRGGALLVGPVAAGRISMHGQGQSPRDGDWVLCFWSQH